MTGQYTGKCLTCGARVKRDDRGDVQSLMDRHAGQLGHDITVFDGQRNGRMMEGFAEGSYRD